jgi:hypothetical protein
MTTTTLKNGTSVLAVNDKKYGVRAKQFVNDTQANVQQMILFAQGIECSVYVPFMSTVRYIKIN